MPNVYLAEFVTVGGSSNFNAAGAQIPPLAEQLVTISGSSVACTNAFNSRTLFVRVHADSVCSIAFGVTPTATVTNMRLAANQTEYFAIGQPGYKVAVIQNT